MMHIEVGRGEKKMHQVISSQNHQRFGTLFEKSFDPCSGSAHS